MKKNNLNVFVADQQCGTLTRSAIEKEGFLFDYGPTCPQQLAVSMTMPVVPDQYDSMTTLHPIFEMNLPEGALRDRLDLEFSKVIPGYDALSLLEIVGRSQLGRLRYAAAGSPLEAMPDISVRDVLAYRGAEDLFDSLIRRYARHSGISGVQPKVLLRDRDAQVPRLTDRAATHIAKSFDPRSIPELAANEYFCMRASALAGLPTANAALSANRSILVVERFDCAPNGTYHGMEDFCVLSGMKASGRYQSSYEKLAERVSTYVTEEHHTAAREQVFGTIVLSCAVGNGDAHLKNFAVLYDAPGVNVRMAPVYDMVSTVQYLPRDAMALTLNGAKDFPGTSALMQFGRTACGLSRRQVRNIMDRVIHGVNRAQVEIKAFAEAHPDFAPAGSHLLRTFSMGVAALQDKK